MRSDIVSVVTYAMYVMGMQLLTDVRKTNGQNLLLTIIINVFRSNEVSNEIESDKIERKSNA